MDVADYIQRHGIRVLTAEQEAEREELRYANTASNLRRRVLAQLNGNAAEHMTAAELERVRTN